MADIQANAARKGVAFTKELLLKIGCTVLACLALAIVILETVFKFGDYSVPKAAVIALHCVQAAIYLAFAVETIFGIRAFYKKYGKDWLFKFWEKRAAKCIYFVTCPVVLILSFVFGFLSEWILIALYAVIFVKFSDIISSFRADTGAEMRIKKSPYSKKENAVRYSVLALFLASFALNAVKLVYNKLSPAALIAFDAVQGVIYALFTAELIVRLVGYRKKYGKDFVKEFWKFNKAEPIYTVLFPVVLVLSFTLGGNNNWIEFLFWVAFFLKQSNVVKRFNDETVFNVIAKSIMLVLVCVFAIPLMNLVAMAFSSSPSILNGQVVNIFPKMFTTYSMGYILGRNDFWQSLGVSVMVTVSGTVLSVLLMTLCAYPLSKPKMPFKKVVMVYFLICMLFSGGMAPKILWMSALHLKETPFALVLPSLINVFNLLLIKGFFEGLPVELEESAKLDGANNYQILFRIMVPLALPMMVTVSMFTAISYWNNFYNALLYITESRKWYPIPMFIKDFFSKNSKDFSSETVQDFLENIKMALILASIIPVVLIYPLTLKFFTKGVAVGSVKG